MPKNYTIEKASKDKESLLIRILPTFKGWIVRQGAKLAAVASAAGAAWLSGKTDATLAWAKSNGASEETLLQIQETFMSASTTISLAITAGVFLVVEMTLSRIAAKHPEKSAPKGR